ncbi:hypothetical protein KJ865_00360, partial [Myxococcota bacterium]|nr:hypothetical protein [Myxococcota bacterium]
MLNIITMIFFVLASPQQPGEKPAATTDTAKKANKPAGTRTTAGTDIKMPEEKEEVDETKKPAKPAPVVVRRTIVRVVDKKDLPPAEPVVANMFKIGLDLYVNFGFAKSDNDNVEGNRWDINRSYLTFGFTPSKIVSAHITLDTARQAGLGAYNAYLKFGWLEFKDFSEITKGVSLLAGQVENGWKQGRENATKTRYFVRTLLDMYSIIPEGDLGIWVKGSILDDMLTFWIGTGNGSGYMASEMDKGKAVDLHGAYHLKTPLPIDLGIYFRTQVNDNFVNPQENTLSITTAASVDVTYEMIKFGMEGFYHTYNDWLDDGLGNLTDIRHNFYGGSIYVNATPNPKVLAFLRADLLWYRHGTLTDEPAKYNSKNVFLGGGYNLFKNFWLGASLGIRKVKGIVGVIPPLGTSMSSGYYAASDSIYWNDLTDGELSFTV